MATDTERILAIKTQTLELIQHITLHPKPTYTLDGQQVAWEQYLAQLRSTIDWCDEQLAAQQPCEIRSQGYT
jgi:hypothetical protein